MSVSSAIYSILSADAALAALVGDRIFPSVAPAGTISPWLVYQRISERPTVCHQGASGLSFYRYQISAYSKYQNEAEQISDAVKAALDGAENTDAASRVTYTLESSNDTFEEETGFYGVQLDFFVSKNQ